MRKAEAACKVYMTDLLDERLAVAPRVRRRLDAERNRSCRRNNRHPRKSRWGSTWSSSARAIRPASSRRSSFFKPGGTLMLVGIPPTVEVQFDAHLMRHQGTNLPQRAAAERLRGPRDRVAALRPDRRRAILTHRFPLGRIRDAFELVAGYRDGVIKAVVDLSGRA